MMIGVRFLLVTTSQFTPFGPWNHVDSMLQLWGPPRTTRPNLPYALPASVVILGYHTTLYTNLLQQQYLSVILVSVRIIRLKPSICTARMACAIPKPQS